MVSMALPSVIYGIRNQQVVYGRENIITARHRSDAEHV